MPEKRVLFFSSQLSDQATIALTSSFRLKRFCFRSFVQGAGGRFHRPSERRSRGLHLFDMVAQRHLPEVRPLGHGAVEQRPGRIQPRQRRADGVGVVRQLRRPEHVARATGAQAARIRQARHQGGVETHRRDEHLAARAHQRQKPGVAGPVPERWLRRAPDARAVHHSGKPVY